MGPPEDSGTDSVVGQRLPSWKALQGSAKPSCRLLISHCDWSGFNILQSLSRSHSKCRSHFASVGKTHLTEIGGHPTNKNDNSKKS